jgi:hypothetical protein
MANTGHMDANRSRSQSVGLSLDTDATRAYPILNAIAVLNDAVSGQVMTSPSDC